MKTTVIHLDQYDDISSARDKIRWGEAGRILLVWPANEPLLNRRLDLIMLRRECEELGAKVAIVSRDPDVRYNAPRLGIPVYKSVRKAQDTAWRVMRRFRTAVERRERTREYVTGFQRQRERQSILSVQRRRQLRQNLVIRTLAFTLGVLAFLSIAAIFIPRAEITLVPEVQIQESVVDVKSSPDFSQVDLAGNIPAYWKSITVEGRDSTQTSGSIVVPVSQASGRVTFTNLTGKAINVPEGTVVHTIGSEVHRFVVTEEGRIPAELGATLSLPVHSLEPGVSGNLPTESLIAIEGSLSTDLSVSNPAATSNGTDRTEPAPTQDDRNAVFVRLKSELEESALTELESSLEIGDLLYPESIKLAEVIEETYLPEGDTPADLLALNLRLEFQALVIPGQDLAELANKVLEANSQVGYLPIKNTTSIKYITNPSMGSDNTLQLKMHVERLIQARLDTPVAIQLSLGLSPERARSQLGEVLPVEQVPIIQLTPEWWPRLPILPFRIEILSQDSPSSVQS